MSITDKLNKYTEYLVVTLALLYGFISGIFFSKFLTIMKHSEYVMELQKYHAAIGFPNITKISLVNTGMWYFTFSLIIFLIGAYSAYDSCEVYE